jgi:pimeloyl-ACP methyl ester carboxylesterase
MFLRWPRARKTPITPTPAPHVELVYTIARDGLRLHGALHGPRLHPTRRFPVDALLCLHGSGENFYDSQFFMFVVPTLVAQGITVLCANTRGHDFVTVNYTGKAWRRFGTACEILDECRLDIESWCDWLSGRTYRNIGLVGHSVGGLKCVYSQVHQPHHAVKCVIAVSTPRLSHSRYSNEPTGEKFLAKYRAAVEQVQAGQGDTLTGEGQYLYSASHFTDKHNPEGRYNLLNFAGRLACPALYTFGSKEVEEHAAFIGFPDELRALPPGPARRDVVVIEGGNHVYRGVSHKFLRHIFDWLESLSRR